MKIIGTAAGNNKVLVEATLDEMANLTGYPFNSYRRHDGKTEVKVGDEINVGMIFDHYAHMKNVCSEIQRAKGILDAVSGGLTLADNVIHKAIYKPEVQE